ncbi:MAG: PhzF family phenazine biosynthesis protein [Anaerolineae bacterium]|nr:PhzF family phenazine biosynthesis protein [Anaerolineae bacterium]
MRKLRYQLVDVFTSERFGGNPLAVFTNGRGVEAEVMQRIAKELSLSETVFVLPPDDPANDYRLRIFTPGIELPMAGHPTVGTAYVLAREHLVAIDAERTSIRLEEQVGVIPVDFAFQDDGRLLVTMGQPPPTFGPEFTDRMTIAAMLSLDESALDDYPIQVVSCGVPFLFVPIKTLDSMRAIKLRLDIWERAVKGHAEQHVFVFSREVENAGSTVHSRMFAPAMDIAEDPATGAASGPLGCYLVRHKIITDSPAIILSEQGIEMGRPSFIHIQIDHEDGDNISRVSVGGQSVYIGEGMIEI